MADRKIVAAVLVLTFLVTCSVFSQELEDNWNDYLHYTKIGRLDLAKGYAQVILESNPDPIKLLDLSESNPRAFELFIKVKESVADTELAELTSRILGLIEKGRFIRRTDPKIIITEIRRLNTTDRGRMTAVKRLQNSGEYAIMYMLTAMSDTSDKQELSHIIQALSQIGRDSIRPLAAGLQTENVAIKAEIIKALGKIGYPQSLAHLKYVVEKEDSAELREFAKQSISEIDPAAMQISAAQLFYKLAENYYYHAESLAPVIETDFANIWFWDAENSRLSRKEVDRDYFYELMAMRTCEWALKADPSFGRAIGLWLAAFFKAESAGISMPDYFGPNHADASVYATAAGPEYLHQALERAIKDKNGYIALGVIEALAVTAGEKSLLYRYGPTQPLLEALSFDEKAVRYSAAIAIASAGPKEDFIESKLVIENLAAAIREQSGQVIEQSYLWNASLAESYALRVAEIMLKLAQTENPVFDLSLAIPALIDATKDNRPQIKILAAQTLARQRNTEAQRAIAAMALDENNPLGIRISGFNSLAVSAKFSANLLESESIDAIYTLISSQQADPKLRSAAAAAFGSLNLPSQKVKDLIIDQAKS